MSLLPPTVTKPAALSTKPTATTPKVGRKPAARAPQNIKVETEAPRDTPNPPTMPVVDEPTNVRPPQARARAGSLESRIAQSLASVSVIPTFVGDPYSSFILASRSEKFAHDLAELAKVNPGVKRFLENALDGGAWGGVIFSGAAMIIPILVRYRIIPGDPSFDPFAMFYPPVPAELVPPPRTPRASRAASTPSPDVPPVRVPPSGGGAGGTGPIGVVTVQPGMVPPVNPAAAGQ